MTEQRTPDARCGRCNGTGVCEADGGYCTECAPRPTQARACGYCPQCNTSNEQACINPRTTNPRIEPMTRPSFEQIYMELAVSMSRRSTCERTNSAGEIMRVGCAITSRDYRRVLAVGYNGNASGLPNKCDSTTPGACGCIHAEENAVISCTAPREVTKVVFASHLPCVACAKRIIQLGGVCKVYYLNDYRIRTSLELFDSLYITHEQLRLDPSPQGDNAS